MARFAEAAELIDKCYNCGDPNDPVWNDYPPYLCEECESADAAKREAKDILKLRRAVGRALIEQGDDPCSVEVADRALKVLSPPFGISQNMISEMMTAYVAGFQREGVAGVCRRKLTG